VARRVLIRASPHAHHVSWHRKEIGYRPISADGFGPDAIGFFKAIHDISAVTAQRREAVNGPFESVTQLGALIAEVVPDVFVLTCVHVVVENGRSVAV
jgi:hypothetical protein